MRRQSNGGLEARSARAVGAHQHLRVKERLWPHYMMALGVIITLAVMLWVGKLTLVPLDLLLRSLALCCVVLLLVPFRFTAYRLGMERLEWVLFNVLGLGPLVFSGLLLLNFLWHDAPDCAMHTIEHSSQTSLFYRVELEDGGFSAFPGAREFNASDGSLVRARTLRICTARGALGPAVVVERELVDH